MAERPPKRPRLAWEKNRAQRERGAPLKPYRARVTKPPQRSKRGTPPSWAGATAAASKWLALYRSEKKPMEFIQAFLKSSRKEEAQRVQFLETVCTLCEAARRKGLSAGLKLFCQQTELVESIKVLLEEEPKEHLHTAVRQQAMLAIAALSEVETVLEGKKKGLLQACFRSVLLLPPKAAMQGLDTELYFGTLDAMDFMLRVLVLSSPASGVTALQRILQMLLTFASCQSAAACERAVGRIARLSDLLANSPSVEAWRTPVRGDGSPARWADIHVPILGQLLGRLILCHACKDWEISWGALDALHSLFRFVLRQNPAWQRRYVLPRHERERQAENTSWLSRPSTSSIAMAFGKYLQPSERADIVLVAIKAMGDSSAYDEEAASSILEVALAEPASWLTEVKKIVRCIHGNMERICTASAQKSLAPLLLLMTDRWPRKVVTSLLELSPSCDSAALAMWDVMLSQPHTLDKVLRELAVKLQDQRLRRVFTSSTEDACIHHLALLASGSISSEYFAGLYKVQRYLRHPSLPLLSLALTGLVTLSQRPETARKMLVLLLDILESQQDASVENKRKALLVLRNVVAQLRREEASPAAPQLVEKLLPLFDEEPSQLRELSIGLCAEAMQAALGSATQRVKRCAQRSLLPLFFHMSDQSESVAKASQEALLVAAKLLKWKELKRLIQTQQAWRIGECLLVQDRSRVEEYLSQSLPYLQHAQAPLREAAVRFIGLAARHLRDGREEKLSKIRSALQPLKEDAELSVSSLALQTLYNLSCPRQQSTSGWTLRALCCWPCKGRP